MRVLCRHGHFAFYPRKSSDIGRFSNYFGVTLKREEDYFTFSGLYGAEHYSILGKPYLNLLGLKTYEGKPWDIMRENGFIYHLGLGIIAPKLSITSVLDIAQVGFFFVASGALIQPGTRNLIGGQILSYSGEFTEEGFNLRVLEFSYE